MATHRRLAWYRACDRVFGFWSHGVIDVVSYKESLWGRYFMAAPRPLMPSELRSSDRRLRIRDRANITSSIMCRWTEKGALFSRKEEALISILRHISVTCAQFSLLGSECKLLVGVLALFHGIPLDCSLESMPEFSNFQWPGVLGQPQTVVRSGVRLLGF